ncbi:MAG: DUF6134 family protein [Rhodospirillales bacterium]|jgi:hypothetical protein
MKSVLCAFVAAASFLTLPALAGMPGVPDDGQLDFTVLRNGSPIGNIQFSFESQASHIIVRIRSRILYTLLSLPLYRYEHDSTEVWSQGRFQTMSSKTNDDGKNLDLDVKATEGGVLATLNGKTERLDQATMPASLWNPATYKADVLVDTSTGKRLDIDGEARGGYFTLSGELKRELRYDESGLLQGVRFTARDGSEIRYVRE